MKTVEQWDALARQVDEEEAADKERQRHENRMEYFKQIKQQQFQHQHENDHVLQSQPQSHHSHTDIRNHSHGSSHLLPSTCGCSTLSIEQLEVLKRQAEAPNNHSNTNTTATESTEQKNDKKIAALNAIREDAKQLFQQGKYSEANVLYERGQLIVCGMVDCTAEQQCSVDEMEITLGLNQALCALKLKLARDALNYCRQVLQLIDKPSVANEQYRFKALVRMTQAHIDLNEIESATECLTNAKALKCAPTECSLLEKRIQQLQSSHVAAEKALARRMAKQFKG